MDYDETEWQRPWRRREAAVTVGGPADGARAGEPPPAGGADTLPPPRPAAPPRPAPPDEPGDTEPDPGGGRRWPTALVTALVGGVAGAAVATGVMLTVEPAEQAPGDRPVARAPVVEATDGQGTGTIPAVARAVTPSVVRVDVLPEGGGGIVPPGDDPSALGSGVIYRSDGYILTNNHVIRDAAGLEVRLASGQVLDAEVVGTDPLNDLAVLSVDQDGLPAVNLRDTEANPLSVGETVVAIGSPFGLDASVTAGVVSALNRDITVPDSEQGGGRAIPAVIQTDAAINPGNSGGALVDAQGRVIGINTAIFSQSGGSQGVGFAIPVSQVVVAADELIADGEVDYPFLGVSGSDLTRDVAERFDLPIDAGALVNEVTDGSAAAEAGIEADDIITAVDEADISSMSDLVLQIRRRDPGETVQITLLRDGEEQQLTVTLRERPEDLGG